MLAGGERGGKGDGENQTLHPCMRAPDCWLVERERKREGGRLPMREKDQFQDLQGVPLVF
jgi:hypothetical protein